MTSQPISADVAAREAARQQLTGQFGPQPHAESGIVDLWDPTDGSYAFPPVPRTVEDLVNFWKTVEIPDDALETVMQRSEELVRTLRQSMREKVYAEHNALWRLINEGRGTNGDLAEWEQIRAEAECAAQDNTPSSVPRPYVKAIFRLASMAYWARYLSKEEATEVLELRFKLPGGSVTTPETMWDYYSFGSFYEQLVPHKTEAETTAAMLEMASNITWLQKHGEESRTIERNRNLRIAARG